MSQKCLFASEEYSIMLRKKWTISLSRNIRANEMREVAPWFLRRF